MNYKIIHNNSSSKFIQVEVSFKNPENEAQELHLPSWRPGRYEIQNFAKYIKNIRAYGPKEFPLIIRKFKKDGWLIESLGQAEIKVSYEFYANIQNAGGSFVDAQFLYLNPINCLMYRKEHQDEPCNMQVFFASNQEIACGLKHHKEGGSAHFQAKSFHDLVDSPIMLSSKIQHQTYTIADCTFHIWVKGKITIPWDKVLKDFKAFSNFQIDLFGEFPESEYHFMLWITPQAQYHGVEHRNSTMMTLGSEGQDFEDVYMDLLGLASHELFHAWNAKRIRPVELLPYDYSRENYFETCFVMEGLTTFYGDWVLYRSKVISKDQYRKELETVLKRHFEFSDAADLSLRESSYDLWLDGYQKGIPERKVSVYHKGAIAGLILHDLISKSTAGKSGLDDVMKLLWRRFGKNYIGYSYEDYQGICEEIAEQGLSDYFDSVISGKESLKEKCQIALKSFNFEMSLTKENHIQLKSIGHSIP